MIFLFSGFPKIGTDAGVDEQEKIKYFDEKLKESLEANRRKLRSYFDERAIKLPNIPLDKALSDHFSIYTYPKVCNHYD